MGGKDEFYNRAKQQGYRSRASYKLQQIDEAEELFERGDTVVDLGAAPGGWLQVAAEEVGEQGTVIGVDLQRIDDLDDHDVETLRGDMTDERTQHYLGKAMGDEKADVVVSDMAPNMTGEYSLDHARSVHLARQAFEVAEEFLAPGGHFVVKVFQGEDLHDFREEVSEHFEYVRAMSPEASRDASSEVFLVGKGRITAPVEEGDRLTVEIEHEGDEGDGIAYLEGYSLFVPGAEAGDTVEVVVDDLKPKFGFAELVDDEDENDGERGGDSDDG
ncbi:23S rRNA (uridine(2552)-2'-O)-methyltransferase [Halorubrum gandharaense]